MLTHPSSSLALISARATINSLEVLSLLTASYVYVLCQALDLRAMHNDLQSSLSSLIRELLPKHFPSTKSHADGLLPIIERAVFRTLNSTSTADGKARMTAVAAATTTPLVDFFSADASLVAELTNIAGFRAELAEQGAIRLNELRAEYLEGKRGPAPASQYLGKTKALYEFVRITLGVRLHGLENLHEWTGGPGSEELSIGQNISLIHEVRTYLISFTNPLPLVKTC